MKVKMNFNRKKAERMIAIFYSKPLELFRQMSDDELLSKVKYIISIYGFDNLEIIEEGEER